MESVIWSRLLESMRDATLDGRSWHEVARNVSTAFNSPAVALYGQSTDAKSFRETAVLGIDDQFIEGYKQHYSHSDNPWVEASQFWHPGEIRTEQVLQKLTGDRNVLRRSGYFQDWIQPQGYHHSMGMVVDRDAYGYVKLTLYRDFATGAYSPREIARFEEVCQQFRVMLDIAERYRLVRSIASLSLRALDQLDFGVLLLSAGGEVLAMNQFTGRLLEEASGLALCDGRLLAQTPRAQSCVNRLLTRRGPGTAASAALVPPDVAMPITMTAVDTGSLEPDTGTLLIINCPELAFDERLHLLVERFALTPVEQELARGLLQGFSLRDAGAGAGLSYETSRWYLKQLFAKTDTHRQSELLRLLLTVKAELPITTFH
ncbi:MAG: hypothetical protein R3E82_08690 [Pseudomonadales bacterium]|nr:helix-turn-helix transcriptional regulator [Pseudomonadales bacterium]